MQDDYFDARDEAQTDGDAFEAIGVAYIRPIRGADLPQADGVDPEDRLYALHDASGRPLAIFKDRLAAHVAARTNRFQPVSAH